MKHISWLPLLVAANAYAAPVPHDVCMQQGVGVPTRSGPPAWTTLSGGSTFIDTSLDDPRWNQSTNRTFDIGGAMPPLRVRQLWAPGPTAGTQYLYLSFISDLDPNGSTPRDVFIGFHRAHPGITGVDTGVTGYVFQIHLAQGGTAAAAKAMTYCANAAKAECMTGDWWRMFRDFGGTTTLTCQGGVAEMGEQFKEFDGTDPAHVKNYLFAPVTWLDSGGVSSWRVDSGTTETWAVQLRMLVAATDTAAAPSLITDGLEAGSTMWYEATETVTTAQSVAKFPQLDAVNDPNHTGVTSSICLGPTGTAADTLLHPDLTDATKYAAVSALGIGSPPTDCDTGLGITNIGALPGSGAPDTYDTLTPLTDIKPGVNTLIAQVLNTGPQITVPILATFRLANWGTAINTASSEFTPIRGGAAVCYGGGNAPCTAQMFPAATQKAITFQWTPTDSELCAYGLAPTDSSTCAPCTCDGSQADCPNGTSGTGVTGQPCMKIHGTHECMFVELTSPGAAVNFTQASRYNNLNFAQMSIVAREALVDTRKLPTVPGQTDQDVYLLVMPRNMPQTVAAGTSLTQSIQAAALAKATALSAPYAADFARLQKDNPKELETIVEELARQRPGQIEARERTGGGLEAIQLAMKVMPNDEYARVGQLLQIASAQVDGAHGNDTLVHQAVTTLGADLAAAVVPTLEIYPFYRPATNPSAYQPMPAFTVFLSHESTMSGIHYEIDGADKVATNVYHLKIPVGYARRIQVRAQALQPPEAVEAAGNPRWPGCCGQRNGLVAGLSNMGPGLVAGIFVIGRRRRRKKS